MQGKYDELTGKLSEATVSPDEFDRQPGLELTASRLVVRLVWITFTREVSLMLELIQA